MENGYSFKYINKLKMDIVLNILKNGGGYAVFLITSAN